MQSKTIESYILKGLKKVVGKKSKQLHEPIFLGNEKKYLIDCINSTYVSTVGKYVNLFENKLKKYTKANNAVAIINGTSALQICLKSIGVNFNDEVIIPSLTFIATANAVKHCGAYPNFVDVEKDTFGVCPNKLEKYFKKILIREKNYSINRYNGRKVKALIAVHVFGMPCKINQINKICKKYKIKVIEDAAESIGSFFKKKHLGTFSLAGVISFNGNKTVTCGNGAIVLSNNKKLAKKIKHLSTQAKLVHKWEYDHDDIGYNYRLSNINAAIGCAQMEKLSIILKAKRQNFETYFKVFNKFNDVQILREPKFVRSNYWLISMKINQKKIKKNNLLKKLHKSGFLSRPIWKPLHNLKIFKNSKKDKCRNAIEVYNSIINLPSSPGVSLK